MKKVILVLVPIILFVGFYGISGGKYIYAKGDNEKIEIPQNDIGYKKAQFYKYKVGDKDIKFFLIKDENGNLKGAFDACDVCYPAKKGYSQKGEFIVCNNCQRQFNYSSVGNLKGGCNPSPLKFTISGDKILINLKEISTQYNYF